MKGHMTVPRRGCLLAEVAEEEGEADSEEDEEDLPVLFEEGRSVV